jgi:RNA polymerase sigma-54 factor
MHFSPSILASQRQSLVVNQQLQQAITFLQMSNAELQAFIESQADENPFVTLKHRAEATLPRLPSTSGAAAQDWDRIGALADDAGPSLYGHVTAQIVALGLNAQELALAELFVEALAPSGWLDAPLDEIALRAGVPLATAATMLERLQKLEPAGLFARDLAECLRLQAAEQGLLSPVFAAVLNNLPMLAAADLPALCRVCRTDMDTLRQVLRALRGLNPKPGAGFDQAPMPLRAPDLLVSRLTEGGWRLELNNSTLPAVLVRDTDTPARQSRPGAEYLAERLSVARWLSRAVQYRNQTVLKIGEEILRSQRAFFEHGPGHLRPMILKDIAEAVGIHESTVSRVTNAVTIATPHGCFALKRFFSAALPAQDGNSGSAEAVRERIRKLIQAETPGRPLSDEALVRLLDGEGVAVARRTVAKYREQLRIPTSALRRRQSVISSQL